MSTPFLKHRWVELISCDHAFMMLELDRMPDYGFTGATVWSSFEQTGAFDTYFYTLPVVYRRFAELNRLRDQARIARAADFLRDFSRRAHHHGMKMLHVYHMCNFIGPPIDGTAQLRAKKVETPLRDVHPEWFNAEGEPDFTRPGIYDFMAAEVEDFFDTFPHVDGLFCWNCECSLFTPSRLKHQTISKQEIAKRSMRAVYDVCQKRGKIMTHDIHTAGADADLTRGIIEAAVEMPEMILGADCTYSDWHMHLDTCHWLPEMRKRGNFYIAFDGSGEFFGQGRTIGGWPRWIMKHFANAKGPGLVGLSIRNNTLRKDNSCILLPMLELNLRVTAQLGLHGEVDLDAEIKAWWKRHFMGEIPDGMKEVLLSFEAILEKMMYLSGTNITEYNPDHGFPRKAMSVAPGYPCWHSEQFKQPGTPIPEIMCRMIPKWGQKVRPIAELRQEKLDPIRMCGEAKTKLAKMKMEDEDRQYFVRRLDQAIDFCQAFLHTIDVSYALYQITGEHWDKTMKDPRATLREELKKFLAHANAMEAKWGQDFYRRFTPKMREFAADIPEKLYQG